jgi:Domain of unknown function (DUF4136)
LVLAGVAVLKETLHVATIKSLWRSAVTTGLLCGMLAAPVAVQTPRYGVTVEAEKGVDFAKFKTYSWTPWEPSFQRNIDAQITAAVDSELGALGLTKAASGSGDVLVSYSSLSRADANLGARSDAGGVPPQSLVGMLRVRMLEPGSRRQVLQLRVDKPIDTEPARLEAAIKGAIAEMFAEYPTRRKK